MFKKIIRFFPYLGLFLGISTAVFLGACDIFSVGRENKVPTAPMDVNVFPGDTKVIVSWTASVDTGLINKDGSVGLITKHTVYYSESTIIDTSDSGVTAVDVGTSTTTEIAGLTNNTQYFFVVTAHNATGESDISEEATATPQFLDDRAPGAPTDVNALPGNTKVAVSWTAPFDIGIINGDGSFGVITKYTVYYSESSIADTSAPGVTAVDVPIGATTEIADLTNNTQYFFVVSAHNATGESDISEEATATPQFPDDRVPGAPTDVNAVPGNTTVAISWTAPVDTGIVNGDGSFGVISKHTVYYSESSIADTSAPGVTAVDLDTGTTTEVTGLTNNTQYFFVVTAHNATGESIVSEEVTATPQFPDDRVPGAPTDVSAVPGDTKVTISWTAPVDTGIINGDESPGVITKYTVYYAESTITDTSAPGVTAVDVDTGTTTEVTGLTNNTQYFFVVSAHNATGESIVSEEVTTTPQFPDDRAPTAPTDVNVVPGDTKVTISWTAPVDTGLINGDGSIGVITEYTVYYADSSITDTSAPGVASVDVSAGTTTEIAGLTNNTQYYFVVSAHNATGESIVSEEVVATPQFPDDRVSGAPTNVNAVFGDTTANISWTAPVDTGLINGNGSAGVITKYTVYYADSTITDTSASGVASVDVGTGTTTEIGGLTNNTQYFFVVSAHNATGESIISEEVTATPQFPDDRVPGAPTDVNALSRDMKVIVSWTVPVDTGLINGNGSAGIITKYTVYYSESSITNTSASGVASVDVGTGTTTEIIGLTSNTQYFFVVSAHNATGESIVSEEATATPLKTNIAKFTPTYSAISIVEGASTTASPSWGTGGPQDTDVEYVIKTIPTSATAGRVTVDTDTGEVSVTGSASPSDSGTYTVTATAKTTSSNFTGTKDIDIRVTIKDDLVGYTFSYSELGTFAEGIYVSDAPTWTGTGTPPSTGDGSEVRYDITTRPIGATESHITIDVSTGILSSTVDLVEEDAGDYTVTATGVGDYGGSTTATITVTVKPALPVALQTWKANTRGATGFSDTIEGTALSTVDGLKGITVDGIYHLTEDIYIGDENWVALHTSSSPFAGILHGNGYSIYGITIDALGVSYQGFFAALNNATVNNLGIGVSSIKASAVIGSLAGYSAGSDLTNIAVAPMTAASEIFSNGVASANGLSGTYVGGVVGRLSSGSLTKAFNKGLAVKGIGNYFAYKYVGGLVGRNSGQVIGSSSADVSSEGGIFVGGLVGQNTGQVIGSYSGDVSSVSGDHVGGLAGNNQGLVTGFSSGTASSSGSRIGGLVGYNSNHVTGVTTSWVIVGSATVDINMGAMIGKTTTAVNGYYNSAGGDHVGTTDAVSENRINENETGATGERGTNGVGTGIDGIAHATAANMPLLTEGTEVGEWTFAAGEWPRINLSDSVNDSVDYTTSPPQPTNFFD